MSERTSTPAGAAATGPPPASPLPPTGLGRLPCDATLLYDIGRVDGSGRIASNDIVNALNWSSGSPDRV